MDWIDISEIEKYKEIEGENILVWQKNLVDVEHSRFQRAVFLKGSDKVSSCVRVYPVGAGGIYKKDSDYKNYDLEGDMCQITHFSIVKPPSVNQ